MQRGGRIVRAVGAAGVGASVTALLASWLVAGPVAAQGASSPPTALAEGAQFTLLGVVIVSDERAMALLAESVLTQGQPFMVKKGERIGMFRLAQVLADRVVLEAGGQELTVVLAGGGGSAAHAAAPPPVAGPPAAPQAGPPAASPPTQGAKDGGQLLLDAIRNVAQQGQGRPATP